LETRARVTLLTNFPTEEYETPFPEVEWVGFGSRRNIVWDQYDLPRYLRKRKFDLYWAPSNNGIPFLPVKGTWRISTTHDLVPLRLPKMYLYPKPLFALPYLVWTSAAMLRSETILTVSEASARDIGRIFRRRATVIPPVFADLPKSVPRGELPGAISGRAFVVYNGGLDPRKNVPNLLAGFAIATRQWPDLCLALVGNGYAGFDTAIERLGVSENVVRTGYVDDETRYAIIKAAAGLAYPSLYEGFGLPLLEAFAAGTPVVTAANSSLPEVAGDAAIYVDPHDPSSIARGLVKLRDPETVAELRAKGWAQLARYDPAVSRERLKEAFMSAAQRHEERSNQRHH
jgi:glycosyltransferase involved in cell wall biosynthesis